MQNERSLPKTAMKQSDKKHIVSLLDERIRTEADVLHDLLIFARTPRYIPFNECRNIIIRYSGLRNLVRNSLDTFFEEYSIRDECAYLFTFPLALAERNRIVLDLDDLRLESFYVLSEYMFLLFRTLDHECVYIIYVDEEMRVIQKVRIDSGAFSYVHLEHNGIYMHRPERESCGVFIAHNHVNNYFYPSIGDKETIEELEFNMPAYNMKLLDSVIVTDAAIYSMKGNRIYEKYCWFVEDIEE